MSVWWLALAHCTFVGIAEIKKKMESFPKVDIHSHFSRPCGCHDGCWNKPPFAPTCVSCKKEITDFKLENECIRFLKCFDCRLVICTVCYFSDQKDFAPHSCCVSCALGIKKCSIDVKDRTIKNPFP